MKRLLRTAALMGAIVIIPLARADAPGQALTDAQFVQMASADGLAEINLAKVAVERASRDDVKSLARRMIDDHTKANKDLNRIADSKRLAPAATMDAKHQAMARQLTQLSGEQFDRQFLQEQLKDHEKAVALFENESKNGKDEELKAFAAKTLPTLREHLDLVRKLAGTQGTGTGNNRNK